MGKRKRGFGEQGEPVVTMRKGAEKKNTSDGQERPVKSSVTVQIIVGTYEKVLHGIQATVPRLVKESSGTASSVEFADTFLLSTHGSAIRCLAISPPSSSESNQSQKLILASGSSDQIINLYHISTEGPSRQIASEIPTLIGSKVKENPKNKELGSLNHHGGSINSLYFPTRSKLLSAADDNTIAVARIRDWTVLSTIKAPIPKAHGRPSGDTAPLGGSPTGVNDFAIHPSLKLMVSVGKGEKCMRLWNLVTGKKAGVLNFERDLLQGVGEGRWASGEGRRVEWNNVGEEFVVGFERGCVVFGMDCKPKSRILPSPSTKIHQIHYANTSVIDDETKEILAVSTEDGRILFYYAALPALVQAIGSDSKSQIPHCRAVGQLGGSAEGLTGRIKDFEILRPPDLHGCLIITGSSDGSIRLWMVTEADLQAMPPDHEDSSETELGDPANSHPNEAAATPPEPRQIGKLLGTYEAGNRITCLKAFTMSEPVDSGARGLQETTSANKASDLELQEGRSLSD